MALALVRSNEYQFAIDAITEKARSVEIGTIFTYWELEGLSGLNKQQLYGLLNKLNKELLTDKRILLNHRNTGYKVATPDEQVGHVNHRRKKGARQLKRAIAEMKGVDENGLTPEKRLYLAQLGTILHHGLVEVRRKTAKAIEKTDKSRELQIGVLDRLNEMQSKLDELRRGLNG